MEKEGVNVGECVPLGLLLAEALRDAVAHTLSVALAHCVWVAVAQKLGVELLHCEWEDVMLPEAHTVPLRLSVTELENVGVNVGECVPLGLLLAEELRDAVTHVLCVALPHCEGEAVKLSECVVLPHCEREGVKLEETHAEPLSLAVTEEEKDGVNDGECVPLVLLLAESLRVAVAQALCEALPHCEREGVKLTETQAEPLKVSVTEEVVEGVNVRECVPLGLLLVESLRKTVALALCVALPHCDKEGVKLAERQVEALRLSVAEEEKVGVNVGECVPLGLLLAEELRDAVTQVLCVVLPHCEGEAVKLSECVVLPHCEREGV
jgi:hypothetical protein